LPQEQLQVLTLMYFQGKSGQEVADELSIPLGTVKSRVRLALQKLKLKLSPNGESTEAYAQ
jgi:RNA polymerase sigma-70 factor (ECF subfamily)